MKKRKMTAAITAVFLICMTAAVCAAKAQTLTQQEISLVRENLGSELYGYMPRIKVQRKLSEEYDTPFSVVGKFYGEADSLYYELNGKLIPAATAPEFEGFSQELLQGLGLDREVYRIDSGRWSSDYLKEGEETVRTAEYTGMRKSVTYTACMINGERQLIKEERK